ncbi:ATP-dependent DNA ligase [Arsenicicoccus dermatophilus]|uniref:ATP-dependent DNA ligase n=1 Tax=Arsenicicoccus dermatophilus TaxID=1076331 RepID=UPI001F4CC6F3|nr:ATP-dependent DNA ligase [Arsenicicoccus dermatophilus]MCH8611931.1 ATP-dependent DNA ligase [Arsenicicoccus dermatophilus]
MALAYVDLVATSAAVAATRSRTAKTTLLAELLRRAETGEVGVVAAHLAGVLPQGRVGVGYRTISAPPPPAAAPSLTVAGVDEAVTALAGVSGSGSAAARAEALAALLGAATPAEQDFLRALLVGELRHGAQEGSLVAAVATAYDLPEAAVRRAAMMAGHLGPVAEAATTGGLAAVEVIGLEVGRPVRPMLAKAAPDVAEVYADGDRERLVQGKLDGIRIQVHRDGDTVRVFTRSLDDITDRVPEVVEVARALDVRQVVLDGEAIALRADGRPQPFQVTGARTASSADPQRLRERTPLTTYLFDVLHLDGADLVDLPQAERDAVLARIAPDHLVPSLVTADPDEAAAFFADLVTAGHEGVVIKDLQTRYAAGRRGTGWTKVKPRHTVDLVVLAVEWGSGRRAGLLSTIHLGARLPDGEGFAMLGKTFKGMTDEMLAWQTRRFLELETHREGGVVHLRPEQVVEVAVDGIQTSRRYPAGMALRFARVLRYRDDKTAAEADTVDVVRALHAGQESS